VVLYETETNLKPA